MSGEFSAVGVKLVASGACLSRLDNGEIMFVENLLPGESAIVVETKTKGRTKFGKIFSLESKSPDRVDPPCKYVAQGCGGCDWQHITVDAQNRYKRDIVVDALTRVGKILEAENIVDSCVAMSNERYRTSARILVNSHSWGFRKLHSNEMVSIDDCLVMHPECVMQANEVVVSIQEDEDDDEINEATVRRAPDTFHEVSLSVSQKSFFQGHIQAPQVLSELLLKAVEDLGENLVCVDLYSGVGIFALALAQKGHKVIAVEGNPYAVGDAHKNLDGLNATVVHSDVKKFRFDVHSFGDHCDVVVADPSREGITKEAIDALISCNAKRIVLVSCDPAAGARDISLLVGSGYELIRCVPIDMFGHTHHVEMVSVLQNNSKD